MGAFLFLKRKEKTKRKEILMGGSFGFPFFKPQLLFHSFAKHTKKTKKVPNFLNNPVGFSEVQKVGTKIAKIFVNFLANLEQASTSLHQKLLKKATPSHKSCIKPPTPPHRSTTLLYRYSQTRCTLVGWGGGF